MSVFKKIFSDSVVYGLGNQLPKIINFLMLPILTPFLSPKDYGVFGILVAYISALTAFKALGTTVLLSNSFYKHRNRFKFVWGKIYGMLTIWSILLSIVFALLIYIVLPGTESRYLLLIMFAYSIPTAFLDTTILIGSKFLQFAQKPLAYSLISLVASLSGIVINYILIVHFNLGYIGWVVSMFSVSLVSFICYLYIVFFKEYIYPNFNFSKKWIISKMRIALPVLPHFYSSYLITSSDRVILDRYHISLNDIGLYNLAYSFGGYFAIIGQSLGLALGPVLYKLFIKNTKSGELEVRRITFLLQFGILIVAFLTSLWMKEVFNLMIKNSGLQDAYRYSIILIMSYTYYPLYFVINTKLQYLEKTKYLWRITFSAGLLNIILNVIFIPIFGAMGASVVTFVSLLYLGVVGYFIVGAKDESSPDFYPVRWTLITVLVLISVYLLKDVHLYTKIIVTGSIISIVGFLYANQKRILSNFES